MVIHETAPDRSGAGRWDLRSTRYIPMNGGSRSRLPLYDDPEIKRYRGFVGIDEFLTPTIFQIATLYHLIGGKPLILAGASGVFGHMIADQTLEKMTAASVAADK